MILLAIILRHRQRHARNASSDTDKHDKDAAENQSANLCLIHLNRPISPITGGASWLKQVQGNLVQAQRVDGRRGIHVLSLSPTAHPPRLPIPSLLQVRLSAQSARKHDPLVTQKSVPDRVFCDCTTDLSCTALTVSTSVQQSSTASNDFTGN